MNEIDETVLDHFVVVYKSKNKSSEETKDIPLLVHSNHYFLISDVGVVLTQCRRRRGVPSQTPCPKVVTSLTRVGTKFKNGHDS